MSLSRVFRVLHKQEPFYSVLLESRELEDGILLESGTVVSLSSKEKDEIRAGYTKAVDAYGCLGVLRFADDNVGKDLSLYLVLVTATMPVGKVLNCEIFRITGVSFFSLKNGSMDTDGRCSDLRKLLSSGKFYFAWSSAKSTKAGREILDLTVSLQNQGQKDEEERFFWNKLLHLHFKHYGADCGNWLFRVMCGGIDIRTVYVGAQQAKAMVISRLSCERAGTRFNVRGVNDEGNVANFVESEQVIILGNNISSFMQIRGSVPLFWEQPGLNVGSHKVRISRGFEASAPTYERHMSSIIDCYGQCVIVNLLGNKEGENYLSGQFEKHNKSSKFKDIVPMHCFDYHTECRGGKWENLSRLKSEIWKHVENFGCYTYKEDESLRITQTGVARINCLDCLDRTNSTKTYFGLQMLPKQLQSLGLGENKQLEDRFREAFKSIWPVTGDLISRMYAGTGALEGKTKLKDGARSVTRAIQNNFLDQNKQNAIDLLILGNNSTDVELQARASNLMSGDCLQAPTAVLKGMCDSYKEYTSLMPVRIAVGTWNVNGGKQLRSITYKDETLDDWLLNFGDSAPGPKMYKAMYDFASTEDGDLPFVSGDVIAVTSEDEEWMTGACNGLSGIFPAAYVTKLLPRYVALYDFPAQQKGDLDFAAGDIIEVTEMTGEWWKGKVERAEYNPDEPEGTFPASFVEKESPQRSAQSSDFENEASSVDWNKAIDIYAIGFQEMVELSAGNIVNTSHTNQHEWEKELWDTISTKYKYVLLTSEQLVGVCLYIFVRPHHAPHIRDVEIVSVKTGMGGATGNKGGIGIRMQFYNSSLCFVCSHLAAGQSQIQDRNNDFDDICKRMSFRGNKSLYSHDYVFWCGDLNYRIDMPIEEVKQGVLDQDWSSLLAKDQLTVEKSEKRVFNLFTEGEIKFAPTYKYDLRSDNYDTSEKLRTPAWTDRVLWFRRKWFAPKQEGSLISVNDDPEWNNGKLLYYNRAEIKISDHRPVIAILDIDVLQTDEEHFDATFHKVVTAQGPPDASVLVSLSDEDNDFDLLTDDLHEAILEKMNSVGEVILIRPFMGKLLVIFNDGTSAVKALTFNGATVNGTPIFVTPKSGHWEEEVEQELRHRAYSTSADKHQMEETPPFHSDAQEIQESDYNQNYIDESYSDDYGRSDYYNDQSLSEAYYDQYQIESATTETSQQSEEVLEDVNDPGWACEADDYYVAENIQPVQQEPKKPAPPRPTGRPIKKHAPPRPDTLPTILAGPPPIPSHPPSITPGPPDKKATPPSRPPAISPPRAGPSNILIPEPAPLANKPPKPTPRSAAPKRRAPAPPPGKPPSRINVQQKTQAPPPLPLSPPKGPARNSRVHMNAAFIPENHSAPSLLDLDPLGPISTRTSNLTNRPSSAGMPVLEPFRSTTLMPTPAAQGGLTTKAPPPIAPRRASAASLGSFGTGPSPLPVNNAWSGFATLQPTLAGPSLFGPAPSMNPPPRKNAPLYSLRNPNYKPMVPAKAQDFTHTFQGNPPLQPQFVPLKPTVVSNGSALSSQTDPFGFSSSKWPTSQRTNPSPSKNDPWGAFDSVNNNGSVPNSFSTDFSKMSFN